MNKWDPHHYISLSFVTRIRRTPSLVILVVMLFVFAAYLQQSGIKEYSRYNWLQGNRELLSLRNSAAYDLNSSTSKLSQNALPTTQISPISCSPKYNIVFLKTHKCASSTIQNIFMRNGYMNNKIFVLPATANYLGHPKPFEASMVPDPQSFKHEYNILTHHARLNYLAMSSLMPKDTLFITIVRDPVSLFESMFHYYRLDKFWNTSLDIFDSQDYKIPSRILTDRYVGKIGINQMMFDLGLNISDFNRPEVVTEYIQRLDSVFDLVMLSEKMDESLVLLKHLLCWDTNQVVAFKLNARKTDAKSNLTLAAHSRIKSLNWADGQLYKHFKRKFNLMIKAFGSKRMEEEVNELRNRANEWFEYCVGSNQPTNNSKSDIIQLLNKQRDNATCWLLTALEMDFTKFLRMRQINVFPGSVFIPSDATKPQFLIARKQRMHEIAKSNTFKSDPRLLGLNCKGCVKSDRFGIRGDRYGIRQSDRKGDRKGDLRSTLNPEYELSLALEGKKATLYW